MLPLSAKTWVATTSRVGVARRDKPLTLEPEPRRSAGSTKSEGIQKLEEEKQTDGRAVFFLIH
jgi:hypothetical protein